MPATQYLYKSKWYTILQILQHNHYLATWENISDHQTRRQFDRLFKYIAI